ncbi:MAG TPA: hypothetical protein VM869_35820 [Enhygromyxa sp.]|nr:hypothetical protein [Enhygromyxa sp.]
MNDTIEKLEIIISSLTNAVDVGLRQASVAGDTLNVASVSAYATAIDTLRAG